MDHSLEKLRRAAKRLRKSHQAGESDARQRLRLHPPKPENAVLQHADYLHVVAQENGFSSWPQLKLAVKVSGMDRAQKQQRLNLALYNGQNNLVQRLLSEDADLAEGMFGLQCALYNRAAVAQMLADDPSAASRKYGPRRAILHLAFSKHIHAAPERAADMLAIAGMLVAAGADVNDSYAATADADHRLSALYGAIGHGDNMVLAQWLLDQGADPDDGESLYHSCELPHAEGLKMLLQAGAKPSGSNALLRALDFEDQDKIRLLLAADTGPNAFKPEPVGGATPPVIPALHQAARRMRSGDTAKLLLAAGMDANQRYQGLTPYATARAFGNAAVAGAIAAAGGEVGLNEVETVFANAADGQAQDGVYLDVAKLPEMLRAIIADLLASPGNLDHIKRLVALGVEYDYVSHRITPLHTAGWLGDPVALAYLISLSPDMAFINGFGGSLLSAIVHGCENGPPRVGCDHIACARLALEHGVALPKWVIDMAGDEAMLLFLQGWAGAHPGQVTLE